MLLYINYLVIEAYLSGMGNNEDPLETMSVDAQGLVGDSQDLTARLVQLPTVA